ncbi:hypothetical protein FA15DRAFT_687660 [Coprinopsis marcescibilis]|uniref:Checkpoint protein RAD24-like helical bundle domain-containing protein n=1 Tax=Coprinopsis marcescibilis TaxID=230819 RepID=A0A5C3L708_COPMA|nr:hypothetical protein FA15DRAFT_687660 [Coprinopsis marcescibilis]
MPPKSSQAQVPKKASTKPSKVTNVVKLGSQPQTSSAAKKRFDPLTAFRNTPPSSQNSVEKPQEKVKPPVTSTSASKKGKGKGKEKATGRSFLRPTADQLWVDLYEPTTEAELAVHIRKVEDVRHWLIEAFEGGPTGKLRKYRRILALTGPAGTGKTSTLQVLSRELGFEIVEWRNAIGESSSAAAARPWDESSQDYHALRDYDDSESLFAKFSTFFNRAARGQNLSFCSSSSTQKPPSASSSTHSPPLKKRQIVLLEDLPNVLHQKTQSSFHDLLRAFVESPINPDVNAPAVPVVIIISDTGLRGEARDERIASGFGAGRDSEQIVDVRSVIPRELLQGPYVTQILFNPIASTLMRKALTALIQTHSKQHSDDDTFFKPSKQVLDMVVESANGDIRSAIMGLQFACVVEAPRGKAKLSPGNGAGKGDFVVEAVTRREQSLALFHLIGKVLYNKRKGDIPSSSAKAKDIQKDKELDAQLIDPPGLPEYLAEHERRASRVDIDTIYADSPIDSSLFSLYIHQNYPQFCNEVEEVEGVADWLSWIDSSGGEAWYQANPHQFHLLTLGTIHSLPSPVVRRSQKTYKPEFFDVLQKEKDARDAVRATREWVVAEDMRLNPEARRVCAWGANEVVLELGTILKLRDRGLGPVSVAGSTPTTSPPNQTPTISASPANSTNAPVTARLSRPPRAHRLFTTHLFTKHSSGSPGAAQVNERDAVDLDEGNNDEDDERGCTGAGGGYSLEGEDAEGGWLEGDDIEDFD